MNHQFQLKCEHILKLYVKMVRNYIVNCVTRMYFITLKYIWQENKMVKWGEYMRKNSLAAYIIIGIGIYFLLKELRLPIITNFYSWQTLLIIIGLAFLIHSYTTKQHQNLFVGTILLGFGIHFHGVQNYSFWIDHWGVYLLIIGIAFLIKFTQTKEGLFPGLLLISIALVFIFSVQLPEWLTWVYVLIDYGERFWPIILIILGIYLLKRKK
nr:hypothetical protein BN993_06417 [Virgibacillus halodenitrificans]